MTGYILLDAPNRAQPQGTYPRRGGAKLSGTCIVHTSEGNWRNGVDGLTRLVQTRADWGCYHRACDWEDIALYYPWEWETWQDTETNNWAVGIAAACKTSDWSTMPPEIREGYYRNMARMAADFVAYMRDTHGVTVPLRRLSGAEARARVPGFAAHGDSGVARSDPGRDFDWNLFFEYTRQALGGISAQGTTVQEIIMALTTEDAQLVANAILDQRRGSTLGEMVNEYRGQHLQLVGLIQGIDTGGAVDPAAIAAAIPEGIAKAVADELAKRLAE